MRSPCLIGWSQISRFDGEPLAAWAAALQATGVAPSAIDSIDVVYCQSWQYDDPAGRLAEAVGATPKRTHYSGIGGTVPMQLVGAAAERIAAGESEVCAVVGGEALATKRALKKQGERPAWSHRDPEKKPFPFEAPFIPTEIAHAVFQAYTTFALRDVARRARLGIDPAVYRRQLGELFAPMSVVAAKNPHAWFPTAYTVDEVVDATADNRMVAYPYTKRMVAVMDVDLAGAVVLASADAADRLGVPESERVYLRGWAYATDAIYPAEHDDLSTAPNMRWAFNEALSAAGLSLEHVGLADLYSCFPSSVGFALDALGPDAASSLAPFTVTGGLPYAGGAGSNYLLSSIATLADRLVAGEAVNGLVSGVGMHTTKHVVGVFSTEPGDYRTPAPDPGPAVVRTLVDSHVGPATVVAYTVHHDRTGAPSDALLICDTSDGPASPRCYAVVRDADLLAALEADEWVGRTVQLSDGGGGVNLATA